jgi:hypothetical protein
VHEHDPVALGVEDIRSMMQHGRRSQSGCARFAVGGVHEDRSFAADAASTQDAWHGRCMTGRAEAHRPDADWTVRFIFFPQTRRI